MNKRIPTLNEFVCAQELLINEDVWSGNIQTGPGGLNRTIAFFNLLSLPDDYVSKGKIDANIAKLIKQKIKLQSKPHVGRGGNDAWYGFEFKIVGDDYNFTIMYDYAQHKIYIVSEESELDDDVTNFEQFIGVIKELIK